MAKLTDPTEALERFELAIYAVEDLIEEANSLKVAMHSVKLEVEAMARELAEVRAAGVDLEEEE